MSVAENKLYDIIPPELGASWVVSYLERDQFSPGHVRILRDKAKTSDRTLSKLLNLAPKTFVSYTKDVSKAKVDTKEHILMLISLIKHGADVFGSEETFTQWLETKNVFLDNRCPMDFLNTISGIRMVDDRLTGMEYGDNI